MPIDFRKPQYFKEFRFGNNLIWNTIKKFLNTFTGEIVRFLAKRAKPIVKLEANFTPLQNLNGYDNPWPSGGGTNLLKTTLTSGTASGLTYTVNLDGSITLTNSPSALVEKTIGTVMLTAGVQYKFNGCSFGNSGCRLQLKSGAAAIKQAYNNQDNLVTPETTGEYTVTFVVTSGTTPNITLYPMIRLGTVTDATWKPNSNICPISGWTECNVTRTGKNLLPNNAWEDGTIGISGGKLVKVSANNRLREIDIKIPAGSYVASISSPLTKFVLYKYDADTLAATVIHSITATGTTATFTIGENDLIAVAVDKGEVTDETNIPYQIEIGSTASDYEAYSGTSVSINFGQTVYSGTLTVNEDGSGSIKARPYYASYNGETLVGPWVSSMDAYAPGATPTTGAQVVDMGGTETTIPLTASQISTLVGTNTIWVNDATGDITVQAYGTAIT